MNNNLKIFEVSPQPSDFTLKLLDLIYKENGPVDKVYDKFGVKYKYLKFWKLIDGVLYCDLKIEKKTIPFSIQNLWNLNKIKPENLFEGLLEELNVKLTSSKTANSEAQSINKFLEEYALIFEINLIYQKAQKELEMALNDKKIFGKMLVFGASFVDKIEYFADKIDTKKFVGNSMEINDVSKFNKIDFKVKSDDDLNIWWQKIPKYKKEYLHRIVYTSVKYERLREMARWLTVKNISIIRKWIEPERIVRKKISSNSQNMNTNIMIKGNGVSAGIAMGMIVKLEEINKNGEKQILFTKVLAPELTDYLNNVVGIVATQGGILSHLAIVAREMNIPVVVGIQENDFNYGDVVEIDGESGELKKIKT
jgi:phosphohistidine swiveling domain-containing protein